MSEDYEWRVRATPFLRCSAKDCMKEATRWVHWPPSSEVPFCEEHVGESRKAFTALKDKEQELVG